MARYLLCSSRSYKHIWKVFNNEGFNGSDAHCVRATFKNGEYLFASMQFLNFLIWHYYRLLMSSISDCSPFYEELSYKSTGHGV